MQVVTTLSWSFNTAHLGVLLSQSDCMYDKITLWCFFQSQRNTSDCWGHGRKECSYQGSFRHQRLLRGWLLIRPKPQSQRGTSQSHGHGSEKIRVSWLTLFNVTVSSAMLSCIMRRDPIYLPKFILWSFQKYLQIKLPVRPHVLCFPPSMMNWPQYLNSMEVQELKISHCHTLSTISR